MCEFLDVLKPYAPLISATSAFVSAIAVVISTWFIIRTAHRKTRRDRLDELKDEMRIYVSNKHGFNFRPQDAHSMLEYLSQTEKYGQDEYKVLLRAALHEMMAENKLEFTVDIDNPSREPS